MIIEKLLGVVLNKNDMEKLKIYEHVASDGYYNQHYEKYYKRINGILLIANIYYGDLLYEKYKN